MLSLRAGRFAVILALASHGAGAGAPARAEEPPKPLAKSIRLEMQTPGSLESALGVRRASGAIDLTRGVANGRLVVDLYHEGKAVATESIGLGVAPRTTETRWEFVVQVIDLDILRLGDGKPGHTRIILTLRAANSSASTRRDVAKRVFPIGSDSGGSAFNTGASSTSSAPLGFLILKVRPNERGNVSMSGAGTIEQALEGNPNSDLMIIRFDAEGARDIR